MVGSLFYVGVVGHEVPHAGPGRIGTPKTCEVDVATRLTIEQLEHARAALARNRRAVIEPSDKDRLLSAMCSGAIWIRTCPDTLDAPEEQMKPQGKKGIAADVLGQRKRRYEARRSLRRFCFRYIGKKA